jgi:hypothetical protein
MTNRSWDPTTPEHGRPTRPPVPAWRKVLLTAHVAVSVAMIGGTTVLVALGVSSLRGADPQTIYPAAHTVEAWVVAPLAVFALGTGVLQAVLLRWGLVTYWWVAIKLAITAFAALAVIFVLAPLLARASDDALAGEAFTTAQRLPLAITPAVAAALLILNVFLGLFKPGGFIRPSAGPAAAPRSP